MQQADAELQLTLLDLIGTRRGTGRRAGASLHHNQSARPGDNRSLRRGTGYELDCIGPFQQGDDVRHIDWSATARTQRTQVRRFHQEVESRVLLIGDLRSAMFFGTGKQPMARTVVQALGQLAQPGRSPERIGITLLTESKSVRLAAQSGRRARLRQLAELASCYNDALNHCEKPHIGLGAALLKLKNMPPRDVRIIVVSDFSVIDEDFARWCKQTAAVRIDALVVADALWLRAPPSGVYPVRDNAGGAPVIAHQHSASDYLAKLQQARRSQRQHLAQCGIRRVMMCSAEDSTISPFNA